MVGLAVGLRGGDCSPPIVSPEQGGGDPVTLADALGIDSPLVTLAVAVCGGEQDTLPLHFNHQGVDGALVALRVQSHGAYQFGAGVSTVLNQVSANRSTDDAVKVHRVVW